MINHVDFEITHITDWMPVSEIPTDRQAKYQIMTETYGWCGVYQVALTKDTVSIGKELVHSEIGYTGSSKNVLGRTYNIRAPKGSHGASRYIRQAGLDRENEVCIRYIYTSESKFIELENKIFELTYKQYGYRFKWTDASAGTTGKYSQMMDYAASLNSTELLDALSELKEMIVQKAKEETEQSVKTKISSLLSFA
jgi:hypothetical protein